MESWPQESFKLGDRVEYRNMQDQTCQGRIEHVEGQGQQAKYTITNEQTMQQEQIGHNRINRRF